MARVELEDGEWQQVITALAMSNPLVVKIASQLQAAAALARNAPQPSPPWPLDGKEAAQ